MDSHDEKEKQNNEDRISGCERERDEYLNAWKRAKADLINYKKDEAKRLEEIVRFANERIVQDMIRVLDSFDLAMIAVGKDAGAYKGMQMIRAQLFDALRKEGLEEIPARLGEQFDPAREEAIMEIESEQPPGTVCEVVERGYMLYTIVIRPSKVKVAKEKKA